MPTQLRVERIISNTLYSILVQLVRHILAGQAVVLTFLHIPSLCLTGANP